MNKKKLFSFNNWHLALAGIAIFPLLPTFGAILIGIVNVSIWSQHHRKLLNDQIIIWLAMLSGWLIAILPLAINPIDSALGLANFLPFFLLFSSYSHLIQDINQLKTLSWILVIPSWVVSLLGFSQLFLGWSSPIELKELLGWVLEFQGNPPNRIASVFMYANILGGYLLLVISLGLGLWIHELQKKAWIRLTCLTIILLSNILALILTESRNAWGILIIIGLAFTWYIGWKIIILAITAIATLILGAAYTPSPINTWLRHLVPAYFWLRLTDQQYNRPIATLRTTQWTYSWNLTIQKPLSGWGLRSFSGLYQSLTGIWLGHPHNLYLMLSAEIGIPSILLLFMIVAQILIKAINLLFHHQPNNIILFSYLAAFLALIIFNTVDVSIFDLRLNTLGWIILASIYGVTHSLRSNSE